MASDGQPGIGKKLSAISEDRVPFFTDLVKTISGKERNPVLEDISEPEVQINIIHLKADTFKITGKNTTVQSSFKIPQDAFTPNIKNFPINQIMHIANNNDNIFYSF